MATLFDCPGCGRKLRLSQNLEGFWVRCPACNGTFMPKQLPPWLSTTGPAAGSDNESVEALTLPCCPIRTADRVDEGEGVGDGLFLNLRRDCEPDRALWIVVLGNSSAVLGSLALVFCGLPGLLGLPLGIAAWLMGNHDLKRMRQGLMDPRGLAKTQLGRECGIVGALLSGVFLVAYTLFFLALGLR
jgi:hypothetical protein